MYRGPLNFRRAKIGGFWKTKSYLEGLKTILSQNWSFRAKNSQKKKEKSLSLQPNRAKNRRKKNQTILSQNWSFRTKNWRKIAQKKQKKKN